MGDLWDLIRALLRHPIVVVAVIIGVMNGLGSLVQKAAQKQKEAERRRKRAAAAGRSEQRMPRPGKAVSRPLNPSPMPTPATSSLPVSKPRSPEEIAAEIRRRLGGAPSQGGERAEEAGRPLPTVPTASPTERRREQRRRATQRSRAVLAESTDDVVHKTMSDLKPIIVPKGQYARGRSSRRRRSGPVYGRSARDAVLAMEVLGPPRALRGFDDDR